tara:strand:- start:869 stop:1888 length:1020 start_codon:yes stop_codon:yes gene_type:complete
MEKKIINIDGLIFSLQNRGGISSMFYQILKNLNSPELNLILYNENLRKNFNNQNIKIKNKSKRIFEILRSVDLIDGEIFHSTYYRGLRNKKNTILISTFYDFIHEYYRKDFKSKILVHFKKKIANQSDVIHCISENTKNDLLNLYGNKFEHKCRVVYPFVSDEYFKLNLETKNQILYVGGRQKYKNFNNVVIAISKIKNYKLKIVGGGILSNNEKLFLNNYLGDRYEHVGFISNENLNIEYNQSKCLVYCSNYEGFGIPIIEAMKSGCPVIVKKGSSIDEVANNSGIILKTADPKEITEAIKSFDDSNLSNKFVKKGIENSNRFTTSKLIKDYNMLYNL